MSTDPKQPNTGRKKSVVYSLIIAGLAVTAVIVSPVSPFLKPGTFTPNDLQDFTTNLGMSSIRKVSFECSSLKDNIEYVIVGGRLPAGATVVFPAAEAKENDLSTLSSEQQRASDILLSEFCNRPDLVQRFNSTHDPSLILISYGCDTASGLTGDDELRNAIFEYRDLYCTTAFSTIESSLTSWSNSIGTFRTSVLPDAREQASDNVALTALLNEAESETNKATASFLQARQFLGSGRTYEAAVSLDEGIVTFSGLVEREDMAFLLDL